MFGMQFEGVSVEDLPQFMASREALIDKAQKLSSYFAFDVLIVRRVEPDDYTKYKYILKPTRIYILKPTRKL